MATSEGSDAEVEGKPSRFILDYANFTVMGRKLLDFLDTLSEENRPDAFAFVECHLMGEQLNAARRRLRKLGWKSVTTSAVPKVAKDTGVDATPDDGSTPHEEQLKKFQNSGGGNFLFQPGVIAHGHHQPLCSVGFRAAQV